MSVLTEVLKLFKYDPATDGDMTFNLRQALNDNWDKLDAAILLAIAAAGAYNPEESYAVGDYCTYKGKLHKCSTAIPSGETWTEAHWTTTTVAAELAELSSQLANVVRVNPGYGNTFFGDDLNDWKRLGTYDSIGKNPDTVTVNAPPDTDGWGVVTVLSASDNINRPTIQLYNPLNFSKGKRPLYYRFFRDTWTEWREFVFSTPPQEFNLPLAEGWSGTAKYFKTQENICVLSLSVTKNDAFEINDLISTLPADCAPAYSMSRPASAFAPHSACTALLAEDGSIRLEDVTTLTTQRVLYANIVFLSKELTS